MMDCTGTINSRLSNSSRKILWVNICLTMTRLLVGWSESVSPA
jgi:hypothetical protein